VEVSWLSREKRREVTLVGSKAEAYLDCSDQKGVLRTSEGTQQISITPSNTLREEVEHFLNCIASHQDSKPFSNQSDGVLGARVVSVLESARESIRQERTMQVQMPTAEEIRAKLGAARNIPSSRNLGSGTVPAFTTRETFTAARSARTRK